MLPTLLDLSGLAPPEDLRACSLARALRTGEEPPPAPVFSEFTLESVAPYGVAHKGRLVMVRDGDWKLSLCLDPRPHDLCLNNLGDDPYEQHNLACDAKFRVERDRLQDLILAHMRS